MMDYGHKRQFQQQQSIENLQQQAQTLTAALENSKSESNISNETDIAKVERICDTDIESLNTLPRISSQKIMTGLERFTSITNLPHSLLLPSKNDTRHKAAEYLKMMGLTRLLSLAEKH
ncbi:hypothetical protein AYI69_g1803 [Smittium culicis]|uniref:Uncharacterized protein n=1 Tax=Smittium culicis TaxID=133412 RepID=A0A1R1YP99_9FUNG|nr:hypothetical protein AYI69_g1803 [Smittium culicis]